MSVDVGNVSVPVLTIVPMTGDVSVLLVNVSVVARPTRVSVAVGSVNVPVLTIVPMTGDVSVLLVNVSVVARPTRVSVDVGSVSVPVLTIVAMTGAVKVSPAKVVAVPPRLTDVEPIVSELLVNAALPILVIVLAEPLIDLLVNVCVTPIPTRVVLASGIV